MSEEALSCRQVWEEMNAMLSKSKMVRNFNRCIDMSNESYVVETDLFPVEALNVYSAYNLEESIRDEDRTKYFSAHRGGSQGDYRHRMKQKIANVVDCLLCFPGSKRAVITIPNTSTPVHSSDDDAKCMREIHFYLDDEGEAEKEGGGEKTVVLNATVWMRAQAAEIFPKNIHFIGRLLSEVAQQLTEKRSSTAGKRVKVGKLFYLATTLVSVRED